MLYKVKLNWSLEAANCYQRGALWTEAITLYEELDEHEKAGNIYHSLDQTENARTS